MGKTIFGFLTKNKKVKDQMLQTNKNIFKTQVRDSKGRFGKVKEKIPHSARPRLELDFKVATSKLSSIRSKYSFNMSCLIDIFNCRKKFRNWEILRVQD